MIDGTGTPQLRIGYGNGKNKYSLVAWIKTSRWNSFACAEMERMIPDLRRVGGSKVFVTDADFDRAKDTPVLVKDNLDILGHGADKVSKALGAPGSELRRVAPARVVTYVDYAHPIARRLGARGIRHINFHPVAGPRQLNGNNPDAPLVKAYKDGWEDVHELWQEAKEADLIPVLTGDLQMFANSTRGWAPKAQANKLKAENWSVGIDWVIYDKRLQMMGKPLIKRLFDHPGFIVRFKPNQKKR